MNGKNLRIYMNGTCIGASTECTIDMQHQPQEVIPQEDWRWREHVEGKRSWSISVSGLVILRSKLYDAMSVFDGLSEPILLTVEEREGPAKVFTKMGKAYPENAKIVARNSKCVTYSISFVGTGKLMPYSPPTPPGPTPVDEITLN